MASQAIQRLKATAAADKVKKAKRPKTLFKPGDVGMIKVIDTHRGKDRVIIETPMYYQAEKNRWVYGVRLWTIDGKLPKSWDKLFLAPAEELTPAK